MRLPVLTAVACLFAGWTALPAQADARVAQDCTGDVVAAFALVDAEGHGRSIGSDRLRVVVRHDPADGGTTCVTTVGGDGSAEQPLSMLAMIVTEDGRAALDRGEYSYHAAVAATETAGQCVLVHGAVATQPFGPDAPATAQELVTIEGGPRSVCP